MSTALEREARSVLQGNWREGERGGVPYAFTCPSVPRYRHQWHWDSCLHAVAWLRHDAARAREELRTVARAARPDGFIPHTVFWDHPARWRRRPLYATAGLRGSRETETIGPPLLAWAWERVGRGDPAFVAEGLPVLRRHLEWLRRERDLTGDGLLTLVLPDESGIDDSPRFDAVYGRMAHHRPGHVRLVLRFARAGWRAAAYAARHDEHLQDVWLSTAYAMSLHAMARMDPAGPWAARAAAVERALVERCYDGDEAIFWDLAGAARRPVRVATWSGLAPALLPGVPEGVRHRVLERQLGDPARFGAPVGVPSVSMAEPSFRPGFDAWRVWRGPSWVNATWLLAGAARELGHAAPWADGLAIAAAREGLREYYHPLTGRGLGARRFGWSALAAELSRA